MFSLESAGDFLAAVCASIKFARWSAHASPPGPAPMIRTSASSCSRSIDMPDILADARNAGSRRREVHHRGAGAAVPGERKQAAWRLRLGVKIGCGFFHGSLERGYFAGKLSGEVVGGLIE